MPRKDFMTLVFKNNEALAKLKEQMEASKKRVCGTVKGTRKTHGFLIDTTGAKHFIDPMMMRHVVNGDVVEAVIEVEGGRERALIEGVVESTLSNFYGVVRVRGTAVWVQAESPFIRNWFFLDNRGHDVADGDRVYVAVHKHPFETGKGKANVVNLIAKRDDIAAPWLLAMHRNGIMVEPECVPVTVNESLQYQDLTQMDFVTIDGESTQDMDDALFASKDAEGFSLWVAIADPSAMVEQGGVADQEAWARGVTTYMPGRTLSMLASNLSEHEVSLKAGTARRAVVCKMRIGLDGEVKERDFSLGLIQSKAKLSYNGVQDYLDGIWNLDQPESVRLVVRNLSECAVRLRSARQKNAVLPEYAQDVRFTVYGHDLSAIQKMPRLQSNNLVEECMVAANRSFAEYAEANGIACLYRTHKGFSALNTNKATQILNHFGLIDDENVTEFTTFVRVAQTMTQPDYFLVNCLLRSCMDKSLYSLEPAPHMGMGLRRYATFTSPIRKYADLVNHRMLKAHLANVQAPAPTQEMADHLNERTRASINAEREVKKHLCARYFKVYSQMEHRAVVTGISPAGIRLEDVNTDAAFFMPMYQACPKGNTYKLAEFGSELWVNDELRFRIGETVRVAIEHVDEMTLAIEVRPHVVADVP